MPGTTNAPQDTSPQARVVGSNYTTFNWRGKAIAYCEGVEDSGQPPVGAGGAGYEVVHPLGYNHPVEIATSRAVSAGTLRLTIRELWRQRVWEAFPELVGTNNIVDVFTRLAATPTPVYCTKIITAPDGFRRGDVYHNVTIVIVPDGDTITLDALTVPKQVLAVYTHKTPLR